jgi:hypothetical protein
VHRSVPHAGDKIAHDTRAIQERIGHRNIQHTTKYNEFSTISILFCIVLVCIVFSELDRGIFELD